AVRPLAELALHVLPAAETGGVPPIRVAAVPVDAAASQDGRFAPLAPDCRLALFDNFGAELEDHRLAGVIHAAVDGHNEQVAGAAFDHLKLVAGHPRAGLVGADAVQQDAAVARLALARSVGR